MQWVVTFYKSGIRPSICHPRFAKAREAYVQSTHGVAVSKRELRDECYWDRGGMCKANPEIGEIQLSKDRRVSYQRVQAPELLHAVKYAVQQHGRNAHDGEYVRLTSWPGWLIFLSKSDCRKIVKALTAEVRVDPLAFEAHRAEMLEALVDANMHAHPSADEGEVRKMIGAPPAAHS